jgi:hypothetical protein
VISLHPHNDRGTATAAATSTVSAPAPLKTNLPLQFPQQPSPNQIKPKPTKPINKRSDDGNGDDEDFDGWLANNPMPNPGDYHSDGEGRVDDDQRAAYQDAWRSWRDNLLDWMLNNSLNNSPRFPEVGEPYYPGEYGGQYDQWNIDHGRLSDERFRQPGDPPLNLPPDMSKEDYEMWKKLLRIKGPEARDLFDWIWRFYRAGQPGFPGVESPVEPGGWVDPLFRNSPSRIPRRPGEYNA